MYGAKVDEAKKELAALLEEQLAPQVGIVDWATKEEVLRERSASIGASCKHRGRSWTTCWLTRSFT